MDRQRQLFELHEDPAALRRFVESRVAQLDLQPSERELLLAIGTLGTLGEKGGPDHDKIVYAGPQAAIEKLVKGARQIRRTIRPRCERAGFLEYEERSGKPSVWKLQLLALIDPPALPADLYPAPAKPAANLRQRLLFPVEAAADTKTGWLITIASAFLALLKSGLRPGEPRTSGPATRPKSGLPAGREGGSPDFSPASAAEVRTSGPWTSTATPDVRGPEPLEKPRRSGVDAREVRTSEAGSPDFRPHVHGESISIPPSPTNSKSTLHSMREDGALKFWREKRRTLRRDIETGQLREIEAVLELHELALEAGIIPDMPEVRLEFAALCYSLWRNRDKLRNPVGFLHTKLSRGYPAWRDQADDQHDRAWAKTALREFDARGLVEEPPERIETPEESRVRQMAELREAAR